MSSLVYRENKGVRYEWRLLKQFPTILPEIKTSFSARNQGFFTETNP